MSIQHERLRSLIEFVQSSARLRSRLVTDVAQHNLFHAHENEIACLPGLHFAESEGDAWLRVERLQEIPPPPPESGLLQAWLDLSPHPGREPELRRQIATDSPTPAGAVPVSGDGPAAVAAEIVFLEACDLRSQVEAEFKVYFETVWKPWAVVEKQRRRTMSLYAQLFTLKQRLEGAIADSPVELVWGVGHALWREAGAQLSYPLLTQPVELILNERTMAIEIRPREVDPGIELDFFAAANKPGMPALEKAAAEFFKEPPAVFSPWDPGSFEPLLRTAVTHLDPSGSYWPGQTAAEDRSLPPADDRLKVTDTWVLFARPRNASLLIQDLERFKAAIDDIGTLPPALFALLSDPSGENPEIFLPAFRGLSMILPFDAFEMPPPLAMRPLVIPSRLDGSKALRSAILVRAKSGENPRSLPATKAIVVPWHDHPSLPPWTISTLYRKFVEPPPEHFPMPRVSVARAPRRSPTMWPKPIASQSIYQFPGNMIEKPWDLIAACIAWLRRDAAIVAAFGDVKGSKRNQKFVSDVELPKTDPPYAVFDEPTEFENYESPGQDGLSSSVARGMFNLTVYTTEKLVARQYADMLAASLNDAPLQFTDGILLYLRRSERRWPTLTSPGNGENVTLYKRVLEFEYLIDRYF